MAELPVQVAIRLRPPLPGECVVSPTFLECNEDGKSLLLKDSQYEFDYVFSNNANNKYIYDSVVAKKIPNLLEGYNVTILAYGSTGSGKTYTMGTSYKELISSEEKGLIPYGLTHIFEAVESISSTTDAVMKASFFEIHMEDVKDLLKKNAPYVSGDSKDARITNMTEVVIKSCSDAISVLEKGCLARTTGATAKNPKSSRSHAIFIINIVLNERETGNITFSKFQMIDLAGSERAGMDTSGKELKAGIQINKGLTALGRVISALSKNLNHIPYRDSLLTKYLQDSFGGNCHTIMITCLSPAQSNVEETISSIRYSNFAKKIKNRVHVNIKDNHHAIWELKEKVEKFRLLIEEKEVENKQFSERTNILSQHLQMAQEKFSLIKKVAKELLQKVEIFHQEIQPVAKNNENISMIIKVLENIKEDLNNKILIEDLCNPAFFDIDPTVGSGKPNISSNLSSNLSSPLLENKDIIQDALPFEEVQVSDKVRNIHQEISLTEIEMRNCENFKKLYEFTQSEEAHKLRIKKMQELQAKRETLILRKLALKKENKIDKDLETKIRRLEAELLECQLQDQCFTLANDRMKELAESYNQLQQSYNVLKKALIEEKLRSKEQSIKRKQSETERQNIISSLLKVVHDQASTLKINALLKQLSSSGTDYKKISDAFSKEIMDLETRINNLINSPQIMDSSQIENLKHASKENPEDAILYVSDALLTATLVDVGEFEVLHYEEKLSEIRQILEKIEVARSEEHSVDWHSHVEAQTKDLYQHLNERWSFIVASLKYSLKQYEEKNSLNIEHINLNVLETVVEFLFKKCVSLEAEKQKKEIKLESVDIWLQKLADCGHADIARQPEPISILKSEISKIEKEKAVLQSSYEQRIREINSAWESKVLCMIEQTRPLSAQIERVKSPITEEVESWEEAVWNKRNEIHSAKCQENEELKLRIKYLETTVEEQQNRLKHLPPVARERTRSKKGETVQKVDDSMMDLFLSDEEEPLATAIDPSDPDFRGTPLYRRNKPKRKAGDSSDSPKPKRPSPTVGCHCPSDCATMRCNCRKKRQVCGNHCDCMLTCCANKVQDNV